MNDSIIVNHVIKFRKTLRGFTYNDSSRNSKLAIFNTQTMPETRPYSYNSCYNFKLKSSNSLHNQNKKRARYIYNQTWKTKTSHRYTISDWNVHIRRLVYGFSAIELGGIDEDVPVMLSSSDRNVQISRLVYAFSAIELRGIDEDGAALSCYKGSKYQVVKPWNWSKSITYTILW